MLARLLLGLLSSALSLSCSSSNRDSNAGFVDVPVAAVAAEVSGQVTEITVREGDRVKRGQVLVRLDARERVAYVAQAEANAEHARAAVLESEQNREALAPTVRGSAADVARQQAELEDASIEFARAAQLLRSGAATQSKVDAAQARLSQARAGIVGLNAAQLATRGRLGAALAGVRTAGALLQSAEAALALARVQLAEAEIRSPFDGLIAELNLEPGEWAAPGTPVVTVEDSTRQWVRLDVEETSVARLTIDQPVEIRVIAFPGRVYLGHLIQVGAEGEFALNRDVKRGRPDVRTFRVRVAFDKVALEVRPGMTAEVVIPQARAES